MNEKEKMINGKLYNPQDSELVSERNNAKLICHQYNNIFPEKFDDRRKLIIKIFNKNGENYLI